GLRPGAAVRFIQSSRKEQARTGEGTRRWFGRGKAGCCCRCADCTRRADASACSGAGEGTGKGAGRDAGTCKACRTQGGRKDARGRRGRTVEAGCGKTGSLEGRKR